MIREQRQLDTWIRRLLIRLIHDLLQRAAGEMFSRLSTAGVPVDYGYRVWIN